MMNTQGTPHAENILNSDENLTKPLLEQDDFVGKMYNINSDHFHQSIDFNKTAGSSQSRQVSQQSPPRYLDLARHSRGSLKGSMRKIYGVLT